MDATLRRFTAAPRKDFRFMDDSLHAAREGDRILHPPLAAELVSGLVEAAVYAAAVAAVGAAIGGAVVAVVGTGGAAAALTPLIAGAMVSAAAMLPAGEDKSIGDHISDFSSWVGNSMFPPEPHGKITSGSPDTFVNGKPAARAAGVPGVPDDQPAQAEEPSILENIGSYAMAAAGMVLPVVGLAQEIHGIFNPPVTTPKAPGAVDAPGDTAECSKHPPKPDQFIAQGSDKVFINGQPAARVGDKTTCDGPIGMEFSPNVRIGGGTVTVRDIHDGKSAAAKIIGLIAGMLLTRRGGKARPKPGKAPKPRSMIPKCKGKPVVVSSGAKLLDGPDDLDFSLPGLLPIEWARRYDSSDLRGDGVFGKGWCLPYEVCLERVAHPEGGELWVYVDEEGIRIELGRLQVGSAFVSSLDGLAFFHQDHGVTVVENIYSGLYQVFRPDPHDGRRSRLEQLGDRNLNRLEVLYDSEGRLQGLVDEFGGTGVELCYGPQRRRVSEVRRLYLRPGAGREVLRHETLASYSHTPAGQLSEVRGPEGELLRRFSYTDDGLMASQTLASGAVFHYQWQRFEACPRPVPGLPPLLEPQPAHEWRVVRHWSEDGEQYQFSYDLAQGHTDVLDSLGRREHYQWGPLHEVLLYVDPLGQRWHEEVVNGQLLASIDPQGGEWRYGYDALGRLVSAQDPLGRSEQVRYTEHWALPTQVTDLGGRTRRMAYDRHGNLTCDTDPLGRSTHLAYDDRGRLLRITDPHGKARRLQWNDCGQLSSYRDCSGHSTRYVYDERGHLSDLYDANGARTRYRFNARGHLLESVRPDGRVDRYEVDAAGQLLRHSDPAQHVTYWQYDARGRLAQRTDAMGLTLRFSWDAYDRLLQLENENGEHYRFQWDVLDRLNAQRNLDGGGQRYHYDASGNLTRLDLYPAIEAEAPFTGSPAEPEAAMQSRWFEHDRAGRVRCKRTADGVTAYDYDNADNLLSVSFTDLQGEQQRLAFGYDLLGQRVSETCGVGELVYDHDELGNLQTLTLPDQRRINYLHYGSGHLHQINLDGRVLCDFERDELHAEVLRSQGRLHTRTRYDSSGRLVQKALQYHDASLASLPLLQKDYQYDAADNLVGEVLTQTQRPGQAGSVEVEEIIGRLQAAARGNGSLQARVRYDLGPTERIHGLTRQLPGAQRVEHYGYDRAGNLLDGHGLGGAVRHNRVKVYQDKRYRYDRFGRLSEKRTGSRLIQHFDYDAEHRLVRVRQQRGQVSERVEFSYDPLGRRTHKRLYREGHAQPLSHTEFFWQGLRLLQEVQDGKPSLYVYADADSYEPLARVDGLAGHESLHYFHTNLAGLPEQLTDEQGLSVWHSDYQAWGCSRDEWHEPGQNRQQNLRYQGQYLDRETGLHYNTFRFYDPEVGRFTQCDPIGLAGGLNSYLHGPNAFVWIDPLGLTAEDIFIHYTNKAGFEGVMNSGVLKANSSGKVYVTDLLMTPDDVYRDILISNPVHKGRGDYAIIFKIDSVQRTNISLSSRLEYIHVGNLRLKDVLFAGKNPYSKLSGLDYDTRLRLTDVQVASRGCDL
ncbi:RHS repeat-associated core domain-containing protein [Pseudomonas xanthosomatis]|uniref:RHS repeat-associated core domain-containing protein n=1 Tax=Pseudomonas xanthosomatis TaxID=2842356 RepID=UPI003515AE9B